MHTHTVNILISIVQLFYLRDQRLIFSFFPLLFYHRKSISAERCVFVEENWNVNNNCSQFGYALAAYTQHTRIGVNQQKNANQIIIIIDM